MKKRKISYYSGFTLIEMLIVLLIISVLVLLFVPNLSRYRNHVDQESREAIIQLVDTQKSSMRFKIMEEFLLWRNC